MSKYQTYRSEKDYQEERTKDRLSIRKPKRSGNKCSNPYCKNDRGVNRYFCPECHSEISSRYAFI